MHLYIVKQGKEIVNFPDKEMLNTLKSLGELMCKDTYFIAYEILILADDCMMDIGTLFSDIPIDEKRVTKEIRNALTINGIDDYDVSRIEEIILAATDGDELQTFDICPEDVWPAEFNISKKHSKKVFYDGKGGDKE